MAKKFRARLDILPAQRRLWDELGSVPGQFVLYGGAALALHLGHRGSEDFDFFADRDIKPDQLFRTVPFLLGSQITLLAHAIKHATDVDMALLLEHVGESGLREA